MDKKLAIKSCPFHCILGPPGADNNRASKLNSNRAFNLNWPVWISPVAAPCPTLPGPVIIKTVNAVNANSASNANKAVNANKVISVNSTAMAAMVDTTIRLGVIKLPTLTPARPTGLSSAMFAAINGQDEMPSNVQLGRCGLPGRATEMGSSGASSLLAF
ncbi:hypothetical protein NEUTE2DRAFT_68311 [Neurospora tetrasperma FGSC 2509]|nr:hypothetical protein NEUTE2DRAFT_68311 [Neurospora tetrasperma FGSC 2509]